MIVDRTDIVVIGAGLAGLAAAKRIRDAGASVLVLEARERVGGRLAPMDDIGAPYDAGGQFFLPTYNETIALARSYSIAFEPIAIAGAVVRGFAGRRGLITDPQRPFDRAEANLSYQGAHARIAAMAATLPPGEAWAAPDAAAWDAVTFERWLGENVAEDEVRALLREEHMFNLAMDWTDVSLLCVLAETASFGAHKQGGELLADVGAQGIVAALAQDLGSRIMLGAPVRAIRQDRTHDGVVVTSDEGQTRARAAIVAMTPSAVERIQLDPPPPAMRRSLQRRWISGPGAKTVFLYDRPWWRDRGLAGVAVGDHPGAYAVIDATVPSRDEGVLVAFSLPGTISHTGDMSLVMAALTHYFGGDAPPPRSIGHHDWGNDDWVDGCGFALPPGLLTRYGPALRAPHGRIMWAGTESSPIAVGGMEGATRSGYRAAAEALAMVGLPAAASGASS